MAKFSRLTTIFTGLLMMLPAPLLAQRILQGQIKNSAGKSIDATIVVSIISNDGKNEMRVAKIESKNGFYRLVLPDSIDESSARSSSPSRGASTGEDKYFMVETSRFGYVASQKYPYVIPNNQTTIADFNLRPFRGSESLISLPDSLFESFVEIDLNTSDQEVILIGFNAALGALNYRYYPVNRLSAQHLYIRTYFEYQHVPVEAQDVRLKVALIIDAYSKQEPVAVIKYGAAWILEGGDTWQYDIPDELRSFIREELASALLQALIPIRKL